MVLREKDARGEKEWGEEGGGGEGEDESDVLWLATVHSTQHTAQSTHHNNTISLNVSLLTCDRMSITLLPGAGCSDTPPTPRGEVEDEEEGDESSRFSDKIER